MKNYFKRSNPCVENGKVVEKYGEKFQLRCNGEDHIWKRLSDGDEFIAMGGEKRLVFCSQFEARLSEKKIENQLNAIEQEQTFENFNGFESEIQEIKRFIVNPISKTLFLVGLPGRGKTHLANGLRKFCIESGKIVGFTTANKLEDILVGNQPSRDDQLFWQEKYNKLRSCNLLIIDDLGRKEKPYSEFFKDNLTELIDEHREWGKLLITTMFIVKDYNEYKIIEESGFELEKYLNHKLNEPIMSRLTEDSITVVLKGEDYRQKCRG